MNSHQPMRPQLLHGRLVTGAAEFDDPTPAVVTTGNEKQIVWSPIRHGRVQAVVHRMRVTPKQVAVVWIDPDHLAVHERDELILPVDIDHDWRRSRIPEIVLLPRDRTILLIER